MRYILLTSADQDQASTRNFNEFDSKHDLARTIIVYFEEFLVTLELANNPDMPKDPGEPLEYVSDDLFEFVDKTFGELVCLELQEDGTDLYIPYASSWVKEAIYLYLRTLYERETDVAMETETSNINGNAEMQTQQ